MSEGFICRNSGDGYATINFNTYTGVVHGSLTSSSKVLTERRASLEATSVGDYALFGGGYSVVNSDLVCFGVVDAYNTNLTRTTPTALSVGRRRLAATNVGDYALFAGGDSSNGNYNSTVDAYNTSLVRTTPTSLSEAKISLAATSVGDYALFGGGYAGSSYSSTVDAYNTSLTRTTPTSLSESRYFLAATRVSFDKDYALFGGGLNNSASNTVDSYNASLTRTTPTSLSESRYYLSASSVRTYYSSLSPSGRFYSEYYAIFAGGRNSTEYSSTVDAYNVSLTRLTPSNLSEAREFLAASRTSGYAFFGGGRNSSGYLSVVDLYDESFLRYSAPNFIESKGELAATNIGYYALFGGGLNSTEYSSTVEHYTVDNIFQVFPETKYKFSGMSSEQTSSSIKTVTVKPPISGYIKVKTTNIS